MKLKGIEFFDELAEYHHEPTVIKDKYPKLRSLLERVCKEITANETIQFSNLFSRLSYVCKMSGLDKKKTYLINTFRTRANKVLHENLTPTKEDYLQDIKSFCYALSQFYDTPIPNELWQILPPVDFYPPKERLKGAKRKKIRAFVKEKATDMLLCEFENFPNDDLYKVKVNVESELFRGYYGNKEFFTTVDKIWVGASVNLVDVTESDGFFYAEYIVLEPDYLIDISQLAECHKMYGDHQLNFIMSRLFSVENKMILRLGDLANLCLDERVFEQPDQSITLADIKSSLFKSYPFEYSTCVDFNEAAYNEDAEQQFLNIQRIVANAFNESNINRNKSTVEPAFFCEYFGIQGRLDLFQFQPEKGFYNIVELKSGKPPYPENNPELIRNNHAVQLYLYYLTVLYNLDHSGINKENLNVYVLYSKPVNHNLRNERPNLGRLKRIINKRNEIVLIEHYVAKNIDGHNSEMIIKQITPQKLITEDLSPKALEQFARPEIEGFTNTFIYASTVENEYFHQFYTFVTRELFSTKLGDTDKDITGNRGVSALWQNELADKLDTGEILTELKLKENKVDENQPRITFSIPDYFELYDALILPNFRKGDIINLYERNSDADKVINKQIFKGSIECINQKEITIRLRFRQRNKAIFTPKSKYAIERDYLDSSFTTMFRALYIFMQGNKDRKDLLLSQRPLRFDQSARLVKKFPDEVAQVILKARQALDYFLLVGPPGTGKTSIALKSMVEEFYAEPSNNILLLSYTNRAVDEICDSLDKVEGQPPYIRIGSELSCDEKHRKKLLDHVISACNSRQEVKEKIQQHRIIVGTVSSVGGKMELFRLKHFQVAIIDESSQILEPHLAGILTAKDIEGKNAIDKFVLIGDHKQLPAVVLQKAKDSKVDSSVMHEIGLFDRRNSLFERLFNLHKADKSSPAWDMLHRQGRMHPEIAMFPNYAFYNNQLKPVPTKHQTANIDFTQFDGNNQVQKLIATKRLAFIPSQKNKDDASNKTSADEAKIAACLVKNILELYKKNGLVFEADKSIGIIAPYRSQIALIRQQIHHLNIPGLNDIMIDTVERFQGSQRDIIIYSFSVNQFFQLDMLANTMEDEGQLIDRKLNVALTRAKKHLFITGNPSLLSNNLIYYKLIEFIRSKGGYIHCKPRDFVAGNFIMDEFRENIDDAGIVYKPDKAFADVFNELVTKRIQVSSGTSYPDIICGNNHDYNRLHLLEFGSCNFKESSDTITGVQKVDLYCFYYMRKYYFCAKAIFSRMNDFFETAFTNTSNRISFLDFGCGPLTAGLAFNQHFSEQKKIQFNYIGIDIAESMLQKAQSFSGSGLFNTDSRFQFRNSLEHLPPEYINNLFLLPNTVILNFSYFFGSLSNDDIEKLASTINELLDKFPLNKYVLIYLNADKETSSRAFYLFRKLVPRLDNVIPPKTETISYRNAELSNFDKTETFYYEVLSN